MTYDTLQAKLKDPIDNSPMSAYQIIIVALCFVLNMNDGIDVLAVSFTGSEIVKEWGLSNTQLGSIFSAGLAGMTAGCLLLAPFGDKIGRRKIFLISLTLITAGMFGVYASQAYWHIIACRLITGLGIGVILPTMATTASEFSNNKTRDFNVGLIQGGWPLGAILTGFFINWAMPEKFKAITALIANLPDTNNMDCIEKRATFPVLIINGTEDKVNPYDGGEVVIGNNISLGFVRSTNRTFHYWAELAGYKGEPKKELLPDTDPKDGKTIERYTYKKRKKPEVTLLKVIGGKHDYPNDIDVHLEAWAFFKRQM